MRAYLDALHEPDCHRGVARSSHESPDINAQDENRIRAPEHRALLIIGGWEAVDGLPALHDEPLHRATKGTQRIQVEGDKA